MGLDAHGCLLLWRRDIVPWWRRGSYATKIDYFFPFEMEGRSREINDQPYIEWLITDLKPECMREMGRREKEKEEKEM